MLSPCRTFSNSCSHLSWPVQNATAFLGKKCHTKQRSTLKSFNGFRKQFRSGQTAWFYFTEFTNMEFHINLTVHTFFCFESKHNSHHHQIPDIIGGLGLKQTFDCLWVEYPDFRLMLPRPGIFLPENFWTKIWATVLYAKETVSLRYQAAGDHCASTRDISELSG